MYHGDVFSRQVDLVYDRVQAYHNKNYIVYLIYNKQMLNVLVKIQFSLPSKLRLFIYKEGLQVELDEMKSLLILITIL